MSTQLSVNQLFGSPTLRIVDLQWRGNDRQTTPEYRSPQVQILLQRSGMFVMHHGQSKVVCDPNTIVFIDAGEPYRMTHPARVDCACTALLLEPGVITPMMRPHETATPDRPDGLFPFHDCPNDQEMAIGHYTMLSLVQLAKREDSPTIERTGLTLARRVVESGFQFHFRRRRPVRPNTARAHAELTFAVKELLGTHYPETQSLRAVAAFVHSAPSHLCWLFKQETSLPIHRYLNRLRLVASLEPLADQNPDLVNLALELGFASQSHFTRAFQREFGMPPSRFRERTICQAQEQIRKNVKD